MGASAPIEVTSLIGVAGFKDFVKGVANLANYSTQSIGRRAYKMEPFPALFNTIFTTPLIGYLIYCKEWTNGENSI